jgi:zinc transporter, ZIP family
VIDAFLALPPIRQAFLAGLFTWGVTALGASLVFLTRGVEQRFFDAMLGFAGGVMLAASFWSLLLPAVVMEEARGGIAWLPAAVGVAAGGALLWALDRLLPHLHVLQPRSEAEGPPAAWRRSTLLVSAITLHNIPEGLAVGVAFGAAAIGAPGATIGAAVALSIGIALQNFPEGVAVAMPLRREGVGKGKCFWYGQLSAVVEPAAAVAGAAFVIVAQPVLPYALALAAGAMIFVVVEEVVPTSQQSGNADLATTALLGGFILMTILDVALG